MPLDTASQSRQNEMLGCPPSVCARSAKRVKLQPSDPPRQAPAETHHRDRDSEAEGAGPASCASRPATAETAVSSDGLEQTLLPLVADKDRPAAVNQYDAEQRSTAGGKKWGSPVYVDAFNLALDTVLCDEAYLFSEEEAGVFARYRALDYEAQYLYVRLFLRKSDKWFRMNQLGYHSDVADMPAACSRLQSADVAFAETESEISTLEDAAGLLSLDELKAVAKDAKCPGTGSGATKAQLVTALKRASRQQGGLAVGGQRQLTLSFDRKGNYINRDGLFIRNILAMAGPCIRLCSSVKTLFDRVHLVFYRSTEWTEKSLTTVILSRTMRRNFPLYVVSRTSSIFPTRSTLLEFEKAIKLQSAVDEILADSGVPTQEGLQTVLDIFNSIYDLWCRLVEGESWKSASTTDQDELCERVYLRRFNAAWVYTRIVHKGVYVLGRFKEYTREHAVLSALIQQRYFQSARRGGWYQRKALVEENYMAMLESPSSPAELTAATKKWRQLALETCEAGLQDPQTHIIYHYDLQKRLLKLEQKLRIPKREQHDFGHARLRKPSERVVVGERIGDVAVGQKTRWKDPAEEGAQCSVEEMCLSVYRSDGWKGYHCEGGVVRTLFACMFYDIFFLYLPNVFETEFQTCPLDLFTDAFYPSRASEINHRLVEIANGGAARLVAETWEREHERRTCVMGLDWRYALEDLLEIVQCFPPDALSTLCKVLCQEYRQRSAGLPDLFLWNIKKKECLFVEGGNINCPVIACGVL